MIDQASVLRNMVQLLNGKKLILCKHLGNNRDQLNGFLIEISKYILDKGYQVLVVEEVAEERLGLSATDDPIRTDAHGLQYMEISDAERYVVSEIGSLRVLADVVIVISDSVNDKLFRMCDEVILVSAASQKELLAAYSFIKRIDEQILPKITFVANRVEYSDESVNLLLETFSDLLDKTIHRSIKEIIALRTPNQYFVFANQLLGI